MAKSYEQEETPEMEAQEHSKGFLKRAATMADQKHGKKHGKKKGKKHSHKHVSK